MKRIASAIVAAAVILLVAVWLPVGSPGEANQSAASSIAATTAGDGYRAAIDPETGVFVARPPSTGKTVDPVSAMNRSSEGLVEERAPVGGGVMVDLRGRFQSTFRAGVDGTGRLSAACDVTPERTRAGGDSR